jgi:hypothetical protein
MAFSNSLVDGSVFGNKRVQFYSCVADGATGDVVTGLRQVTGFSVALKSASTAAIKFWRASTAGTVSISGAVSGDEFYLTVYGD